MYYGVSYYPEHKSREALEQDILLLIESGINTVRMGEFAWCVFEPLEGEFHFVWLEEIVNRLGEAGIKSLICTPTATPPAWLVNKHPEILYTDNRRILRPFGGRRHYCYNSPVYREYSQRIAEAIGKHFGSNPYVIGFQIDNEPAQEGTGRCTCAVCTKKFQKYLKESYGTVESFNKRSGSVFWSQTYDDFSMIHPPVNTIEVGAVNQIGAFYENPTVRLEFERFSSNSQIGYQNIQRDALKKHTLKPVTTNGTGLATNSIDYYKSFELLDVYGFDYYPNLRNAVVDSFPYAFARGIKDQNFWVIEFMSGGGHRLSGSGRMQPNPGALEQAVVQSFAHGAEMMLHFQFRTFPFGAEQLNYAIVDMDGVPRRRYREMQRTAEMLRRLEPLQKAEFDKEVAICMDYDTHWALRIKPVNDPVFDYLDYMGSLYQMLMALGICPEIISYKSDLSKYKLVIVPSAFVVDDEFKKSVDNYVYQGGHLLTTFLSFVKNKDNVGYTDSLPSGMTDVFNTVIEEVEPVFDANRSQVCLKLDERVMSRDLYWSELLTTGDQTIGTYETDYKKDVSVLNEHDYGKGKSYYLGSGIEKKGMIKLLDYICRKAQVSSHGINLEAFEGQVEVVRRTISNESYLFVFNHTNKEIQIPVDNAYEDYLTEECCEDYITIDRQGYKVLHLINIR